MYLPKLSVAWHSARAAATLRLTSRCEPLWASYKFLETTEPKKLRIFRADYVPKGKEEPVPESGSRLPRRRVSASVASGTAGAFVLAAT
eukprot:5033415-Amphidinium_carterae.1